MKRSRVILWIITIAVLLSLGQLSVGSAEETVVAQSNEETYALQDASTSLEDAAGYIQKMFYPVKKTGLKKAPKPQGNNLQGVEQRLYQKIMPEIASIAAGNRASAIFTYPVGEVFDQVTFTASDLGVDAIIANGAFTPEATAAMEKKLDVDTGALLKALLADAPYEMYWFDKTAGLVVGGMRYSGNSSSITVLGDFSIRFAVVSDYAEDLYTVDTSYGQSVSQAVENAAQIVQDYEAYSDYDRLMAYKNEICALTSYNDEAAAGGVPYGNPWQLVWVFDGDPDTTVVCEGYAKAFQYLNDLSSSSVTVISVTGDMDDGAHMWNIVTMDDGKHYLVDVTNCDQGTIGYPDKLFLKGYSSGNAEDGYVISVGSRNILYSYSGNGYPLEDLKIVPWNYLVGKPASPSYVLSATKGYTGFQLAVRLDEASARMAESVLIGGAGDPILCSGRDVLIPLTEAGTFDISLAVVVEGVASDPGPVFSIQVGQLSENQFIVPQGVTALGEEAFLGTSAEAAVIPETVTEIGANAFQGMSSMKLIKFCGGIDAFNLSALGLGDQVLLCLSDVSAGFETGRSFLIE